MSFLEGSQEYKGSLFHLKLLRLENAVVAFFYEGEMRLGTLAVSIPMSIENVASRSSVLLGGRYMVASRILSERLAAHYGKMSLVSLYSTIPETEALRVYTGILNELIKTSDGKV
ncbi:MAG: hypothetical protein ACUVTM_06990 [Candidatus Bathyarchaeia archaeon]